MKKKPTYRRLYNWIRQRHANPRTMSEAEMKARGEGTYCHYGDEARIRKIVREEIVPLSTSIMRIAETLARTASIQLKHAEKIYGKP